MSPPSVWRRLQSTVTLRHDYSVEPLGFKWRQNTFFIVATVGVGLFTDLFLYGLVVPILPFILQDRIGIPQEQVQSYTSALLATCMQPFPLNPEGNYLTLAQTQELALYFLQSRDTLRIRRAQGNFLSCAV